MQDQFQGKTLINLPFIEANLPERSTRSVSDAKSWEWMKNIKYSCTNLGTIESLHRRTDIDVLKEVDIAVKPEDIMHPDWMKAFSYKGLYYFIVAGMKMSYKKLSRSTHLKNLYSTDVDLFYVDKYWKQKKTDEFLDKKTELMEEEEEGEEIEESQVPLVVLKSKRDQFFSAFPPDKIGGIIRIMFELPGYQGGNVVQGGARVYCDAEPRILRQGLSQLIIVINLENLHTFIPKEDPIYGLIKHIYRYFEQKRNEEIPSLKPLDEEKKRKRD